MNVSKMLGATMVAGALATCPNMGSSSSGSSASSG
jgi:hypothetical protein